MGANALAGHMSREVHGVHCSSIRLLFATASRCSPGDCNDAKRTRNLSRDTCPARAAASTFHLYACFSRPLCGVCRGSAKMKSGRERSRGTHREARGAPCSTLRLENTTALRFSQGKSKEKLTRTLVWVTCPARAAALTLDLFLLRPPRGVCWGSVNTKSGCERFRGTRAP